MYTAGHTRIISTGVYLPENKVTSRELLDELDARSRFGVPHNWIDRVLGIRERRVAPPDMRPSEMAVRAARDALDRAGVHARDIDAVIYTGMSRDCVEPATAHMVQKAIGARDAVCFDLTNACHGFMNGIHVLDMLVATGQARRGLVVTGERNWQVSLNTMDVLKKTDDRDAFQRMIGGLSVGDAGAAMLLGPKLGPDTGFAGFVLQSRGEHCDLCVYSEHGAPSGHMDMVGIIEAHIGMHAELFPRFLERMRWQASDINHFIHHQVGKRAFSMHAAYSGIERSRMTDTVSTLGNITSATIPVNLHRLAEEGVAQPGDNVMISGAGSGLSISQTALVWDGA